MTGLLKLENGRYVEYELAKDYHNEDNFLLKRTGKIYDISEMVVESSPDCYEMQITRKRINPEARMCEHLLKTLESKEFILINSIRERETCPRIDAGECPKSKISYVALRRAKK